MEYKLPTTIEEFYANIEQEAHETWDKTLISVMVFGPDINSTNLSSLLRKHILDKCNQCGILVRTEHADFQEAHKKLLDSKRNLCGLEYNAARPLQARHQP
jgi:hypothetical protein